MRIRQLGDPILRQPSQTISPDQIASQQVQDCLRYMQDTLNGIQGISAENGNALSAPQVGVPIRMILLRFDGEFVPMLNPEISARSNETFEFEEECFSFYSLRAKVTRHQQITVRFLDEKGESHSRELEGEAAGLVQHEIDHLDGIFFLDRVNNQAGLRSIEVVFAEDQPRLRQVREMIDYMAS